ncbi:PREDICTED: ATP-dependent DNA helicase PIF1-like [Ipomoea nil]|uniref:ATP-dependent DNA helicase PIF1-like n=1 Tax=Ipomoea nil TaxID=35883 RepID=UPI000901D286|nr:PREDICTED: ATP-dependent DNA helicase PIF1-like [Ipomoea nil]
MVVSSCLNNFAMQYGAEYRGQDDEDGLMMASNLQQQPEENCDDQVGSDVRCEYRVVHRSNFHGQLFAGVFRSAFSMSNMNVAECRTYFSSDSISTHDSIAAHHTPKFLNGLKCSGVPNHSLALKIGSPVMLLRNIDHSTGLCNGTRLMIYKLGDHVVEAKILFGSNAGTKVLIPRLSLTPSDPKLPFKFQRRQFPLMLSYANKSKGQTMSTVGLLLKKSIFVHGQLYVTLSRVSNPNGQVTYLQ